MASGISREELTRALQTVRDFCRGLDSGCQGCLLWGRGDGCRLALEVPGDWDIPWESEEEGGGE